MKKRLSLIVLVITLIGILAGCGTKSSADDKKEPEKIVHVKVGVTGTDGQYWNLIKEKAKEKNIEIDLIEFSDYTLPNNALANGEVDINAFQHLAFLSQFIVENDVDIAPIGSTVIAPMGLYSDKYKDSSEIPDGSEVAIPNDPANLGRGLKVLEATGLVKLTKDVGLYPTEEDIIENPKNIKILPVVAQQTPRVLPDVAASIINSGIAGQAGFTLDKAIFQDDPNSEETRPYLNVFAVRSEDVDNETYKTIAKIYQEEDVAEAVKEDSNGGNVVVDVPKEELQKTLDQLIEDIRSKKQ